MTNAQTTEVKSKGARTEASANWKDFVRQNWAVNPKKPEVIKKTKSKLFGHIQSSL